jgi:hypothetical protein
MQCGGRTGAAAYRSARPGMVQQPQPAAGQLNPVQPSGGVDPNLKVLGEPAGTGGGDSEPWIDVRPGARRLGGY